MSAARDFLRRRNQLELLSSVRTFMRTRTYNLGDRFGLRMYWVTQSHITEATGITGPEMRSLCQTFPSEFISSQHGYKQSHYATREEVRNCVQGLLGRAEKITSRASALAGRL